MTERYIEQILKSLKSIEARVEDQNQTVKELHLKVKVLESQNKKLAQMIHKTQTVQSAPKIDSEQVIQTNQFQTTVKNTLHSIEDNSKKALELIKANGGKKRAWP